MSKKQQVEKNLKLSAELANFLADNPGAENEIPEGASYVFFSATDKELNKVNLKLANSLAKEGKTVIKAEETKDKNTPWRLTPL